MRIEITGRPEAIQGHDPIDRACGDSWELFITQLRGDDRPLNLTDVGMTWRLDSLAGENVLELSIGAGIRVIDARTGVLYGLVPGALTDTVPPGDYIDRLRVTFADGRAFTEWRGEFRVTAE